MRKIIFFFLSLCFFSSAFSANDYSKLYGQWKGVKMPQDSDAIDLTFYLPNEGEMILDESTMRVYYYPYFKSAEYKVSYTNKSISYTMNDKDIRCDYHFVGDTLVFKMFYINKVFIKYFKKTSLDNAVLAELDQFGFRTDRLVHEFEVDTFHKEQRIGFDSYDSLGFVPFQFLEFKKDNTLMINRTDRVAYTKSFKKINFNYKGIENEWDIVHVSGTQDLFLQPTSDCQCDSITIPYMTVKWADRIRQAIIDEENF